jgi:glycosyltransferase involved in cell wall biosynthesis
LNSTEAFGLVQIEAMMNGVPCATSNLPGVRQPVKIHQMGKIFDIGDSKGLADAVLEIVNSQQNDIHSDFSCYEPSSVASHYEALFSEINRELHPDTHSKSI